MDVTLTPEFQLWFNTIYSNGSSRSPQSVLAMVLADEKTLLAELERTRTLLEHRQEA